MPVSSRRLVPIVPPPFVKAEMMRRVQAILHQEPSPFGLMLPPRDTDPALLEATDSPAACDLVGKLKRGTQPALLLHSDKAGVVRYLVW